MKKILTFSFLIIIFLCFFPCNIYAITELYPVNAQYKVLNSTKVKLRWDKVPGADVYYIYKISPKTGNIIKKYETNKTNCLISELIPNTIYCFGISTIPINGTNFLNNNINTISFQTPAEWYYYKKSGYGKTWDEFVTSIEIYRKNEDETVNELFDISDNLRKIKFEYKNFQNWTDYRIRICQKDGYVYYQLSGCDSWDEYYYCLWRTDNYGNKLKYLGDYEYEKYVFIMENFYIIENKNVYSYPEIFETDDDIDYAVSDYKQKREKSVYYSLFSSSLTSEIKFSPEKGFLGNIYKEKYHVFSNIVSDGKYIYFSSEPNYTLSDEKDTILYKAEPNGDNIEIVRCIPYDNKIKYASPYGGSFQLISCDGKYAYYYIVTVSKSNNKSLNYNFFKISIIDKEESPKYIIKTTYMPDFCYYTNGNIYFTYYLSSDISDCLYYKINTVDKKITYKDSPYVWQ